MRSPSQRRAGFWIGLLLVGLVAAGAAAVWFQRETARWRSEVSAMRTKVATLEEQRQGDQSRIDEAQAAKDELDRLRKQTEEIHRLRGQYQELQRLKAEYAKLEQENQQLKASQSQLSQSLREASARPAVAAPAPPASWIGVVMQANPGGGVLVQDVAPTSPAAVAGLSAGDVITAVDGRPMGSTQQLRDEIARRQVGQTVVIDALRSGAPFRVNLTTAPFPR